MGADVSDALGFLVGTKGQTGCFSENFPDP